MLDKRGLHQSDCLEVISITRSGICTQRKGRLAARREQLVGLLADAGPGVRLNDHIEDVDGAVVFRQACVMGLESIVAKQATAATAQGAA